MKCVWLVAILFIACSDNKEDGVLARPPYELLTDSISKNNSNAGLYYRRGNLLYENQKLEYAEADYKKAWALQQTEDHAIGVTKVLIQKNQDSAIHFIEQALAKVPRSVILRVSLAKGYQKKKEFQKAITVCDQIITEYPNQLDALMLKAELLK